MQVRTVGVSGSRLTLCSRNNLREGESYAYFHNHLVYSDLHHLSGVRFLDNIIVKGRVTPLAVYTVAGLKGELEPTHQDCMALWLRAIESYNGRDWAKAIGLFEQSKMLEPLQPGRDPGVHTTPSEVMLTRCHLYSENDPGPDWDGVFVLPTK